MNNNRSNLLEKIREKEELIKDTIEKKHPSTENTSYKIKDIKFVGIVTFTELEYNNSRIKHEDLFIIDIEKHTKTPDGKEVVKTIPNYYLGTNQCIGGIINENFEPTAEYENERNENPDKCYIIDRLIDQAEKGKLDIISYNDLKNEELSEVLSAYLGKEISPEEAKETLRDLEKKPYNEKANQHTDEDTTLTEEETEEIKKIQGVQEIDLSKKVDGKETLEKRLMGDNCPYSKIMVVYSDRANDITGDNKSKVNNTNYTLIGIPKDSNQPAKILNDEFEIDPHSGSGSNEINTKIQEDGTATRDNNDRSTFRNKNTHASIGIENEHHSVNIFFYPGRTHEENENVGIEVETQHTRRIPVESREILNRNRGNRNLDNIQDEVAEHTTNGCTPESPKDFDGIETTQTHEHEIPDANHLIPNTTITWGEFAKQLGYRGDGAIEQAVKSFEERKKIDPSNNNQEIVTDLIEEANERYHPTSIIK